MTANSNRTGALPPDRGFAALASAVVRSPRLTMALCLATSAAMGWLAATKLQLDTSVEAFTSGRSTNREVLERFRDLFGRDDLFVVMAQGDVFSNDYLQRLRALHDELAGLDLEVPSLGQRWQGRVATPAAATRSSRAAAPAPSTASPPALPPSDAAVTPTAAVTAGDDPFAGFDAGGGEKDDDLFGGFDDSAAAGGGRPAPSATGAAVPTAPAPGAPARHDDWQGEAGGTIVDEIVSILNVRRTFAEADAIRVGAWLDPIPPADQLPALRAAMLAERSLVGQVLGADGRQSVISLRTGFMSEDDSARVYAAIMAITARHQAPGFDLHVAGPPALGAAINDLLLADLRVTGAVAALMMLSVMFFLFRHPLGMLGPLLVVGQAALWTFGLMALVGWKMTMISNILPAFLVCVGVGDSVHLQSVYRDALRRGEARGDALRHAVGSCGIPVLFTSLTTMAGLGSFYFADIDAIAEMGLAGAFGVGAALLLSMTFLPALLTFHRRGLLGADRAGGGAALDGWLDHARLASHDAGIPAGQHRGARRRVVVLGAATVLAVLSLAAMTGLRVYHNPLRWIPSEFPVRTAFDLVDAHAGGTANVQLLVTAPEGKTIKDLEMMRGLERLIGEIERWRPAGMEGPFVGNTISLLDIVKETNRALHGGDPAWYRLPDDDRQLSDLLFFFENAGPSQLRRLATNDLRRTQVTIRVRWLDATSYAPFTAAIERGIATHIGARAKVEPTGAVYSLFGIVSGIIRDLLTSFGTAFAIITVMMALMLGGLRSGIIAMAPNLLPILMIMGIMGALDIPIDMSNLLIASIAIGIAVDDTIHFLHHFQVHHRIHGQVEAAIAHSFHHSGRAMVGTSVILALGFCVYVSAQMANLARFGMLIALTVVLALVADLYVTPAILRATFRDRARPPAPGGQEGEA